MLVNFKEAIYIMKLKKLLIMSAVLVSLVLILNTAFADDVQVWQDPKFDFNSVNKILIMPVDAELKATRNSLKPSRRQEQDFYERAKEGIRAAFKKRTTLIVKSFDDVAEDMSFIFVSLALIISSRLSLTTSSAVI